MRRLKYPFMLLCMMTLPMLIIGCVTKKEYAEPNCAIHEGSCVMLTDTGGYTVVFDMRPKPVRSMKESRIIVRLARDGVPVTDAGVQVNLSMPGMIMAPNLTPLMPAADGSYTGQGAIIRCPSGRKTWRARVTISPGSLPDQERHFADFIFRVER